MVEILNSQEQKIKTVIDNQSVLLTYSKSKPICIARSIYLSNEYDLYSKKEIPFFVKLDRNKETDGFLNEYYKNIHGLWTNMSKIKTNEISRRINYYDFADNITNAENIYVITKNLIPSVYFLDSDRISHFITSFDGEDIDQFRSTFIQDDNINLSMVNINNGISSVSSNSIFNKDLKIEFTNGINASDILVSLNGIFVEYLPDSTHENIVYILNAKHIMNTIALGQKTQGTQVLSEDKSSYLLEFEDDELIWYYQINMKIWKWDNISLSQFILPIGYNNETAVWNKIGFNVSSTLVFKDDIDLKKSILFCNGIIVDPKYYDIIDNNKIYLKEELAQTIAMLEEVWNRGYTDPTKYVKDTIRKRFKLIKIDTIDKSIDNEANVTIDFENLNLKDYPYIGYVYCKDYRYTDLIILNGEFLQLEYNALNYLSLPRYVSEIDNGLYPTTIANSEINRIRFLKK